MTLTEQQLNLNFDDLLIIIAAFVKRYGDDDPVIFTLKYLERVRRGNQLHLHREEDQIVIRIQTAMGSPYFGKN